MRPSQEALNTFVFSPIYLVRAFLLSDPKAHEAHHSFPGEVRVPNLTEGIILHEVDGRAYVVYAFRGLVPFDIPAVAFRSRCFPPRVVFFNGVYFQPS